MSLTEQDQSSLERNWPLIQGDLHQLYPGLTTEQLGDKPDAGGIGKLTGLQDDQVEALLTEFAQRYRNSDPDQLSTNPDRLTEGATRVGDDDNPDTDPNARNTDLNAPASRGTVSEGRKADADTRGAGTESPGVKPASS